MVDGSRPGAPVELSREETEIMLGHFAGASLQELAGTTGLSLARVWAIASRLADLGLIDPEVGDAPIAIEPAPAPVIARPRSVPPPVRAEVIARAAPLEEAPVDAEEGAVVHTEASVEVEAHREADERDDVDAAPEGVEETREYRKLFEQELHPLAASERAALAARATGATLFALCFDPDPQVIAALLDNAAASLPHARMIAFHHRDSRGLDDLAARAALLADPMVNRRLVRNPSTTETLLRRLLGNKRLLEIYRLVHDRDLPDRSRVAVRGIFRARYARASPEERVDLVWSTEGRVLAAVPDLTFDGRTIQILCTKSYTSVMLIQSLARFSAAPPPLLAHLLRQPLVKRQVHLKNQILKHPNTPSDAKRRA